MFENIRGSHIKIVPKYLIGIELERMLNNFESFKILKEQEGAIHILVYIYNYFYET